MAFKIIDGVLFSEDETMLIRYPGGRKQALYIMPPSVTRIAPKAFQNCNYLAHVVLSEHPEHIDDENFLNCSCLEDVYIPQSVQFIGKDCFRHCCDLKNISFESLENVTISDGAFCSNPNLQAFGTGNLVCNSYVSFIKDGKFGNCGESWERNEDEATPGHFKWDESFSGFLAEGGILADNALSDWGYRHTKNLLIISNSVKEIGYFFGEPNYKYDKTNQYSSLSILFLGTEEQWEHAVAGIPDVEFTDV